MYISCAIGITTVSMTACKVLLSESDGGGGGECACMLVGGGGGCACMLVCDMLVQLAPQIYPIYRGGSISLTLQDF